MKAKPIQKMPMTFPIECRIPKEFLYRIPIERSLQNESKGKTDIT